MPVCCQSDLLTVILSEANNPFFPLFLVEPYSTGDDENGSGASQPPLVQ